MLHAGHQELYDRRDAARKAQHEGKELTLTQVIDLAVLNDILPENPEDLEKEHSYYKNVPVA